ncbi:helix-turn-helix transcriptional regulator [Loktanella sp. R86503]|uniref:helix-turn-helix transcriptional regulator n=1 Tax=Loktanella sp. R86503 TaxID=3093847 RepID=UPI0036DADD17
MAQTVYLSVRQVAEHLGVSTDSIYRWKRHGEFPAAVKLGPGSVRWRLADVKAWEATRTTCFAVSFCGFEVA